MLKCCANFVTIAGAAIFLTACDADTQRSPHADDISPTEGNFASPVITIKRPKGEPASALVADSKGSWLKEKRADGWRDFSVPTHAQMQEFADCKPSLVQQYAKTLPNLHTPNTIELDPDSLKLARFENGTELGVIEGRYLTPESVQQLSLVLFNQTNCSYVHGFLRNDLFVLSLSPDERAGLKLVSGYERRIETSILANPAINSVAVHQPQKIARAIVVKADALPQCDIYKEFKAQKEKRSTLSELCSSTSVTVQAKQTETIQWTYNFDESDMADRRANGPQDQWILVSRELGAAENHPHLMQVLAELEDTSEERTWRLHSELLTPLRATKN